VTELIDHLSTCASCRAAVAVEVGRKRRLPWIAGAIVGCAALMAIVWLVVSMRTPDRQLMIAAARAPRVISARLTDLSWTPVRQRARSASARPEDYALLKIASRVLKRAAAPRRVAFAHLVLGQRDDAAGVLRTYLEATPDDAESWSDLGATLHEMAVTDGRWYKIPAALAAVDRALRVDPRLPQARFNRALILDTMGLRRHAAIAWRAYLEIDPSGSWAEEARSRLSGTGADSSRTDVFRRRLEQLDPANAAAVRALVTEYPQQARTTAETVILREWGNAELQGNADAAAKSLTMARAIGAALLQTNREALLSETVSAIDSPTPSRRRVLALAHSTYSDARQLYSEKKAGEAQPMLLEAAAKFASASSPMADVANYYVSNTLYDTGAIGESSELLRKIAARLPAHGHDALDGQVH
jgi:tetratricopeptide (TPR) repeat protein